MSISVRWGVIALVAMITSFTARYSMYNPKAPMESIPYLILGIFALFVCILVSLVLNRRHLKQDFDAKKGLQEGMKTGLFAIMIYSFYMYLYLSYFNPGVIENLIAERVNDINASGLEIGQKEQAINALKNEVTPFRRVTQELLILLSIATSSTLFGTIIVKKFPI
ncbi:MAG: DUF4199 domain-containing protein [Bacteroidia bacterium]